MNKIIEDQYNNKKYYIKNVNPPRDGFCIILKDNKINKTINGLGWVHPTRKKQYIQLIENVLLKYKLQDCNININLSDHPKKGVFNFCRIKNDNKSFLLPNHRFTNDDIILDSKKINFKNYDEQKNISNQ